jgi:hypothetical protein
MHKEVTNNPIETDTTTTVIEAASYSSSCDFGVEDPYLRRSFRVSWSPANDFLTESSLVREAFLITTT